MIFSHQNKPELRIDSIFQFENKTYLIRIHTNLWRSLSFRSQSVLIGSGYDVLDKKKCEYLLIQ